LIKKHQHQEIVKSHLVGTIPMDNENKTGENPNYPTHFLAATSIIGDKVTNPQNEHLGSIKDIMIDLHKDKKEYVVIELSGFFRY